MKQRVDVYVYADGRIEVSHSAKIEAHIHDYKNGREHVSGGDGLTSNFKGEKE